MTNLIYPTNTVTSSCAHHPCSHTAAPELDIKASFSRRRLLRTTLVAVATGMMVGSSIATRGAKAQTVLTPEAALQELMDGNRRFAESRLVSFDEDLNLLKKKTVEKQEPFAAVLSCADSRVPVELVFDQTIGQIFVTRVAGNIASTEMIASLEYGAEVLGTKAIMVLAHGNCGAVKATIAGKAVPGQISALYRYIRPAVDQAGTNLEAAIKANAKIQAALLRESSPLIASLLKQKKLNVVAGYYDLASGTVTVLD